MRTLLVCSFALTSAALFAADAAPAAAPAAPAPVLDMPAPPPPPAPKLTPEQEKQAFVLQGYFMARQGGMSQIVSQLGMNDAEVDALFSGMRLAVKGEELPFKIEAIAEGADAFFNGRAEASMKAASAANVAFLAKVDADPAVKKTASGLRYLILAEGSAEKPVATSTVKALYTGKLADGKVFDSTDNRGKQPMEFSLGGVIRGWTEGLQLIGKGGKIHLWVPAEIGYGPQGNGAIPGGAVLDFEVELVDFK